MEAGLLITMCLTPIINTSDWANNWFKRLPCIDFFLSFHNHALTKKVSIMFFIKDLGFGTWCWKKTFKLKHLIFLTHLFTEQLYLCIIFFWVFPRLNWRTHWRMWVSSWWDKPVQEQMILLVMDALLPSFLLRVWFLKVSRYKWICPCSF